MQPVLGNTTATEDLTSATPRRAVHRRRISDLRDGERAFAVLVKGLEGFNQLLLALEPIS